MNDGVTKEKLDKTLEICLSGHRDTKISLFMETIKSLCEEYRNKFPDVAEKYKRYIEEEKMNSKYQKK